MTGLHEQDDDWGLFYDAESEPPECQCGRETAGEGCEQCGQPLCPMWRTQERGEESPKPQDLLPCPFCGYVIACITEQDLDDDCPVEWIITCWECEFDIMGFSEAEAVEKWNRRSPAATLPASAGTKLTIQEVLDEIERRAIRRANDAQEHQLECEDQLEAESSARFAELVGMKTWIGQQLQEAPESVISEAASGGGEGTSTGRRRA